MDTDLGSLSQERRPSGSGDSALWESAAARVDALLRAYRVRSHEQRAAILLSVMAKARELYVPGGPHPVELSCAILFGALRHQMSQALGEKDFARARLELWVADAVHEIPHFLAGGVRRDSMSRVSKIASGPDLELAAMVPRKIDLGGVTSLADTTFRALNRRPLFRSALMWGGLLVLLTMLFWITR